MTDTPLVSADWLEEHLDDDNLRIIEVIADEELKAYKEEGHIPGAAGVWWKAFCWHPTDREFVTPEQAAERLGALGVSPDMTVVLYGDPVQYGTYAFWAYTMAGHKNLKVLDGGRGKWIRDGRPLSKEIPSFEPQKYAPGKADKSSRLGRENVREHLGDDRRVLLDFRSPEEYAGERVMELGQFDHGAERKGRIPGAKHMFFKRFLNDDDTYKAPEEIARELESAGVTENKPAEVVNYCRLSHRATLGWFAMRYLLGMDNVKIYDGSWTEWGSIVGYPVEP